MSASGTPAEPIDAAVEGQVGLSKSLIWDTATAKWVKQATFVSTSGLGNQTLTGAQNVALMLVNNTNQGAPLGSGSAVGDATGGGNLASIALWGWNGTTYDRLKSFNTGLLGINIMDGVSGTNKATVNSTPVGADANVTSPQSLHTINYAQLFNSSSWDRCRNNHEITALASAARVATTNSADLTNYNARGALVALNCTVNPGGGETIQLLVQAKDTLGGNYLTIAQSAASALGGVAGSLSTIVYPGATSSPATSILSLDDIRGYPLTRVFRIRVVHSASGSWTYSISANLIN